MTMGTPLVFVPLFGRARSRDTLTPTLSLWERGLYRGRRGRASSNVGCGVEA